MKQKRVRDVIEGRKYRELAVVFLNKLLSEEAKVRFVHEYWWVLSGYELKEKNTLSNRIFPQHERDKAVGLDCLLSASWTSPEVPLIIRRKVDRDLYYKLPGGIPKDDLVRLYLNKAYFLLLDDDTNPKHSTEYSLVRGSRFWWNQSTSEGNENRVSAVQRNGKRINPKLNLPWTDIAGRKRGFWQAGPDLKTALLELLRGGGDS